MNFAPLIRWSGGKRKQSEDIIARMPKSIGTVWIPFLGGGSVMFQLLNSNIKYDRIVCSDTYEPLMAFWKLVQTHPESLEVSYKKYYDMLIEGGEKCYLELLDEFNAHKDNIAEYEEAPHIFNAIVHACLRGSIEFDKDGNFCTKYQTTKNDNILAPQSFANLLYRWSELMQDVEFRCESYEESLAEIKDGDYCFFDPPYIDGTWYRDNNLDMDAFYDYLRSLPCDYSITLNGDRDIYPIPDDCYTDHEYIYYGVRVTNGRPSGSRDSFWTMHKRLQYRDKKDRSNVRQNAGRVGGKIPQVNDINMLGDIQGRVTKLEELSAGILSALEKLNQKLEDM